MKYRTLICLATLACCACSDDASNGDNTNNDTSNVTNNVNNTSNATNNVNNTSNATNNVNNTSNATNNTPGVDFIAADVDGTAVIADAAEGGVEPMDPVVQLRKTTGETSSPVQIFRITIPAVEVTTYDCTNPDVSVIYSELNGQLINNWASSDTCIVDISAIDPVVGTFSASTSDGTTTREITDGEFRLTP